MDTEANIALAGAAALPDERARALAKRHLDRIRGRGRHAGLPSASAAAASTPAATLRTSTPVAGEAGTARWRGERGPREGGSTLGLTAASPTSVRLRRTYAQESEGLRDALFPAGSPSERQRADPASAEEAHADAVHADERLAREAAEEEQRASRYGQLSAYLTGSLAAEQSRGDSSADYLDSDDVAGVSEEAQLAVVRKSIEEERKKLGPLRAARKLAEKRRKETAAEREGQPGFSLVAWSTRRGDDADAADLTASAELEELERELQKEDLLLQKDRLRLQSGEIESEEPERGVGWALAARGGGRDGGGGGAGAERDAPSVDQELEREARLLEEEIERRRLSSQR